MHRMHSTMQKDPQALRLHRELLLCLARGDTEGSSDVAALLAKRIGAAATDAEAAPHHAQKAEADASAAAASGERIPYSPDALADVTDKLSSTLAASVEGAEADAAAQSPLSVAAAPLTVTIIDSNFELEAADEPAGGEGGAAVADDAAMKVLSQYLESDDGAWRAQKQAVAKAVLDAARTSGITPDALLQSDVATGAGIAAVFSPFTECNVVVRCEVPPPSGADSLAAVEEQLAEMRGLPEWDAVSEAIAKRELEMGLVSMRYKVGLHYSIEAALGPKRCAAFVSTAMRLLNNPAPSVAGGPEADFYRHLAIPAMPYTYMVRLCLWMEDPAAAVPQ